MSYYIQMVFDLISLSTLSAIYGNSFWWQRRSLKNSIDPNRFRR